MKKKTPKHQRFQAGFGFMHLWLKKAGGLRQFVLSQCFFFWFLFFERERSDHPRTYVLALFVACSAYIILFQNTLLLCLKRSESEGLSNTFTSKTIFRNRSFFFHRYSFSSYLRAFNFGRTPLASSLEIWLSRFFFSCLLGQGVFFIFVFFSSQSSLEQRLTKYEVSFFYFLLFLLFLLGFFTFYAAWFKRFNLGVVEKQVVFTILFFPSFLYVFVSSFESHDGWFFLRREVTPVSLACRCLLFSFLCLTLFFLSNRDEKTKFGELLYFLFAMSFRSRRRRIFALKEAIDAVWLEPDTKGTTEAMRLLNQLSLQGKGQKSSAFYSLFHRKRYEVDLAGYMREFKSSPPPSLFNHLKEEKYALVRADVLNELAVYTSELRELDAWMSEQEADVAILVGEPTQIRGLFTLVSPASPKWISAYEIFLMRRFGLAFGISVRYEEHREIYKQSVTQWNLEKQSFQENVRQIETASHRSEFREYARNFDLASGTAPCYAPSTLMLQSELCDRVQKEQALVLCYPLEFDVVGFLAKICFKTKLEKKIFLNVDCTFLHYHDENLWKDPERSPLKISENGILLLLSPSVLPEKIVQIIVQTVGSKNERAENRQGNGPGNGQGNGMKIWMAEAYLDLESNFSDFNHKNMYHASIYSFFEESVSKRLRVPPQRERLEDIRPWIQDKLRRDGMRVSSGPKILNDEAYSKLLEHVEFLSEDSLRSLVLQLLAFKDSEVLGPESLFLPQEKNKKG